MEYSLTNPQNSIWLTEKFYPNTSINNISGYTYISEVVDFKALTQAVNEVIKTNDAMRIKIKEENNKCVQYITEYIPFDVETINLSSENDIEKKSLELAKIPFKIEENILFKFTFFKLPNQYGGFFLSAHHIIGDSWSLGLVVKQVMLNYSNIKNNTYSTREHPSYISYINDEKKYLESSKFLKDKEYWNDIFKTVPEIATIPSLKKSTNISSAGNRANFTFDISLVKKINEFCKANNISLYNFFMSVYSLYLGRVSNLDDFVIGTPILNRTNFEQKNTVGMFISTTPLRVNLNHELTFVDFIKDVSAKTISLFRHQRYPYQYILEDIRKRDSSIPNLYNVVLSYQITKTFDEESGVNYSAHWLTNGCCADDLQIHLLDLNNEGNLHVAYDYKTDKYTEQDIAALHARILTIVDQVMSNTDIILKNIEIVTPEEKHKILYDFNNTKVDYPKDKTIVDLFEEQVNKTPDNIAVVFENQKLTYRELNEKANQLARYLITNGAAKGDIIGIYLNKSLEVLVSMFAILKCGASFLPLDIEYPEERLKYILENSKPKIILSSKNVGKKFTINPICVDLNNRIIYNNNSINNLHTQISAEDIMYIMYTSGSTGKPKGVMVKHKNIVRLAMYPNFISFSKKEVMVQTGTIVFDACIFEIFGSLLHGFKLYIIEKDKLLDIEYFSKFLKEKQVTILFLTTALFNQIGLQKPQIFSNLKYLLTGGDVISRTSTKKILDCSNNLKIINCYGPTENGSYSTCYHIRGGEENIPIGKPITNSTCYIVNSHGNLCPIGTPGELWVGGSGVAKGYLNNKNLTDEKFIKNPFNNGIIYKTGDIVKWLPNGNIEFIGRLDNQIKIRGFRIELSEIDNNITNYTGIKQSISTVYNINNSKIICSYILADEPIDTKILKKYLSKTLPNYMIPSYIIQLDKLPLNINGKIDRKALPIPSNISSSKNIINFRNSIDKTILSIVKSLSNQKNISIDDNFFDLGIDSLSSIIISDTIKCQLNINITVKDIFDNPTIEKLSDYISTLNKTQNIDSIKTVVKKDYYPMSSPQKRIYFSNIRNQNSTLYNTTGGIIVDKLLDINKLQECFRILINRHEALRTHFDIINNEVVQVIDDNVDFNLSLEKSFSDDLNKIYYDFVKPFDLSIAPLFRTKVVKLNNNKMLILLDMHHIISDGTSLNILLQELCDLYNNNKLSKKQLDYKDFTLWEKAQFETDSFKKSREFWVNQFKDEIPLLNMPTDYPRPSVQSFEGSNYHTKLSKETFDKINKVAKELNITPYMLLLSCYYILLSKYTSQNDIVIGTPIVGRELPELSNMLGMFVNTLAIRNKIENTLTFKNFSMFTKEICLNSFKNQAYPFDMLINDLNLKRDTSRNPLFDVMFVYQNQGYPRINFKDANINYFLPDNNISKFDLTLEIVPINNEYSLRFEYCTKLFKENFIRRLSLHYINILNTVLENVNIKIADIDMISEQEKNQILYEFNNTQVYYPKDKTIVDLFEEQVKRTPDNIAVIFENQKLTYRELNEKSNQLARYLLRKNVSQNSIVGIMLPRSLEMIVGIIAILKSGCAYLPLDITYPQNRINYILDNSNVNIVLTTENINSIKNDITNININLNTSLIYKNELKNNLNLHIFSSDLAYVIYTSGSTGKPKGVMVTHQNVNNFILGVCNKINFTSPIVSITTFCFDIFVLESLLPLQKGLTIVIANESEQTIPELLNKLCKKYNVKMLQTTPSKFNLLTSDPESIDFMKCLDVLMLGGESFPSNLLEKIRILSKCKIYNMYGPTETTVWSTIKDLSFTNNITIGTPISNTTIYVLDNNNKLLPIDIPGKLFIGGDSVSNGYLNNKNLSEERFIKNPYNENEIIYDTGDLVKWSDNKELIYLGRSDFQVKIRGLRIELKEIEEIILSFNKINSAIVTVNQDSLSRQILCAYFVSENRISVSELKEYLGKFLPSYMVPTYIIQLSDFKYTPNGKIDRKKLPSPKFNTNSSIILPPKTDMEKYILSVWEKILCISPISINDNFFDIGGDSLLALKVQMELLKNNISVSYEEIFKYNSIKKLAGLLSNPGFKQEKITSENYDYTDINSILAKNNIDTFSCISFNDIGNVLLTGSTGFLGIHILSYLLEKTTNKVYCLIRKDPSTSIKDKILSKLHFYFGNKYDSLIGTRIIIINSDLTENDLGISESNKKLLINNVSCVINSAALVKHYGTYKDFQEINVLTVQKLINFCENYNKRLIQISTISVSGNTLTDLAVNKNNFDEDIIFSERDLFINQSLENVYVHSKFEAEKLILEEVFHNKLNALILRVGNITNRLSDGKFQQNTMENAFANRLRAFLLLKQIPEYLLKNYIEFTPVDTVAEAIVKSIQYQQKGLSVLHLYNSNHVYIKDFVKAIPTDYSLKIVSHEDFKKTLNNALNDAQKQYVVSHLLNDLDSQKKLIYDAHIKIDNTFSLAYLLKFKFKWPNIDKRYIENLLKNI